MAADSSIHRNTPSLTVNDGRGLPVRQVAYLRTVADVPVEALVTRLRHDIAGRLVEQQDPRLSVPNLVNVFGLSDQPLKIDSVDAGLGVILPGLAGEEQQRWDARGNHWRTTYDDQLRAVRRDVNAMAGVEKMTYADATEDAGHNLRGQMIELEDASGSLKFHSYALTGPALRETRTFHDDKAFVSRRTFSPLNTVLETIDAAGHKQQPTYDVAGQLIHTRLQTNGQLNWHTVLNSAQYNADGQITEQHAGNGVISRWNYRAADGRLHRHYAKKSSGEKLQDYEYEYDAVGNITRILDHAYIPTFFRNQLVDGHREFSYDSLYRLIRATGYSDAPPKDDPGRPQPTDPNDRRNFIETYDYGPGDNLVKTTHVRDGANHTFETSIDPASNHGVRWKPGDPPPEFAKLFDPAGNLLALQPGQPMQWNLHGELEKVTLVDRNGSSANDEECYGYSQEKRIYKRHETHTTKVSHFHEVRYLPELEIRTKDNGEELHVITLDIGPGGARCLHWEKDPANIGADQLRFTLADHLGSAVKELDAQAQLISEEGYRPFGVTAFYTKRSAIEVGYKTVRYSGKEMDATSLYYYGARYYAPWLGRWISADPAYAVDGLNMYAFVGNNPIARVDADGQTWLSFPAIETSEQRDTRKAASAAKQAQYQANMTLSRAVDRHKKILELTTRRAQEAEQQILNHQSAQAHGKSAAIRTATHLGNQTLSYGAGIGLGAVGAVMGSVAGPVGVALGIFLGFVVKKSVSMGLDFVSERMGLSASVKFKSSKLSSARIVKKGEYKTMNYGSYVLNKFRAIVQGMIAMNRKGWLRGGKEVGPVVASVVMKITKTPFASEISAALSTIAGTFEILHEVAGAGEPLSPEKKANADANIDGMVNVLNASLGELQNHFANANRESIHTYRPLNKVFGSAPGDSMASLADATGHTIAQLRRTQNLIRAA
ncbi:toxin [Pseudomonas fluorescens]|uniref:Toxin n=1 Tax=Pseudomonas fluorescens TaxID=294 RepID=A0AAE2AAQ1_PSEFL|nr:toxin [Pseudomonas fluorescens]